MKTILGLDALGSPIHEGDLLLDGSGRVYLSTDTENSFLRQGIVRVHKASLRWGAWTPADAHTYVLTRFVAVIPGEGIPISFADRRSFYEKLVSEGKKGKKGENTHSSNLHTLDFLRGGSRLSER